MCQHAVQINKPGDAELSSAGPSPTAFNRRARIETQTTTACILRFLISFQFMLGVREGQTGTQKDPLPVLFRSLAIH